MKRKPTRKPQLVRAKRPVKALRKTRAAVKSKTAKHKPAKAKQPDAIAALVAAGAQALGLTIDPAWRDSVVFNLRLILRHAALVDEFALPEDAEPAPVFHA
jgi:hypothetical protein